jgi:hypothetical protein
VPGALLKEFDTRGGDRKSKKGSAPPFEKSQRGAAQPQATFSIVSISGLNLGRSTPAKRQRPTSCRMLRGVVFLELFEKTFVFVAEVGNVHRGSRD